jgi:hypothetical protein
MNGFLPPVIFEIQANAAGAIAQFKNVNKELSIMEAKALKAGKALTNFEKAAVVGTRALKVMAVAFAAFAAFGVKELIVLEKSFTKLGQAMAAMGVATEENLAATSDLLHGFDKLGFGAEFAADAYSVLITATGSVTESNKLLAVSADLARLRTIGLEEASRMLVRAQAGNARLFTQFGIVLDDTLPKAQAIEKAMGQLEARLSGQAVAYTKTFAGQVAVLNEQLGGLAEQVGMVVLPVLNKFVNALSNTGTFIKKNQDFVIALSLAITVALIPAVVSLTKKLALLALTILKSPIGRLAVIIFGVAYAFVKAYNSMEGFRKGIASIGKFIITFGEVVYRVMTTAYNGILLLSRGGINARIALGKLLGKDEWVRDGQEALKQIDAVNAGFKENIQQFDTYRKKLDDFATKKISLNFDFKAPQIPGFENGTGIDGATDDVDGLSDALINARQRVKDFNLAMKDAAKILKDTWSGIVGKDVKAAITEGLLNPVDKLIVQAQKAVNAYQNASNQYNSSLSAVTAAQNAYTAAVKNGNKEMIASTESALRRAEDAATGIVDTMQKSLEDTAKLQEDMIDAIVDSYNQISELEKQRTEVLANAAIERRDLEKNYLKDTAQLRKQYEKDVLNAQQEAAKRSAEIVKQSVDQLRGVFKTATSRSIADIFSGLTFGGLYAKGGTTEKILASLGLQTSKAKTLANDAATLAGLGFSQTFIEEVVAQGPDVGHQLAQTIIKSSPESIAQMRAYWEALQKTSSHGVDAIATQLNSGVVLATEELTAQLAQVGLDLNTQLAEYNETLTTELADAFAAYSEALDKINIATAKQINEIDAQIATLQARIAQLQSALNQIGTISAPGTIGNAPTLTVPILTAPSDTASAEATAEAAEAAAAAAAAEKELADYLAKIAPTPQRNSGSVADWRRGEERSMSIVNNIYGNVDAQEVADATAWSIRTSGDVQYRVNNANSMGFK